MKFDSVETVVKTFTLILGITSILLLIPAYSGLSVFSRGEFIYIESVGLILAYLTLFLSTLILFYKKEFFGYIKNKLLRVAVIASLFGLGFLMLLLIITFTWIRFDVKGYCQEVKQEQGGDCVETMISVLQNENQSFRSRNRAIYVLGQLADNRALPVLKSLYTGEIPQRESLYKTISQYELKKAIKWCEEGNITSWMYINQESW